MISGSTANTIFSANLRLVEAGTFGTWLADSRTDIPITITFHAEQPSVVDLKDFVFLALPGDISTDDQGTEVLDYGENNYTVLPSTDFTGGRYTPDSGDITLAHSFDIRFKAETIQKLQGLGSPYFTLVVLRKESVIDQRVTGKNVKNEIEDQLDRIVEYLQDTRNSNASIQVLGRTEKERKNLQDTYVRPTPDSVIGFDSEGKPEAKHLTAVKQELDLHILENEVGKKTQDTKADGSVQENSDYNALSAFERMKQFRGRIKTNEGEIATKAENTDITRITGTADKSLPTSKLFANDPANNLINMVSVLNRLKEFTVRVVKGGNLQDARAVDYSGFTELLADNLDVVGIEQIVERLKVVERTSGDTFRNEIDDILRGNSGGRTTLEAAWLSISKIADNIKLITGLSNKVDGVYPVGLGSDLASLHASKTRIERDLGVLNGRLDTGNTAFDRIRKNKNDIDEVNKAIEGINNVLEGLSGGGTAEEYRLLKKSDNPKLKNQMSALGGIVEDSATVDLNVLESMGGDFDFALTRETTGENEFALQASSRNVSFGDVGGTPYSSLGSNAISVFFSGVKQFGDFGDYRVFSTYSLSLYSVAEYRPESSLAVGLTINLSSFDEVSIGLGSTRRTRVQTFGNQPPPNNALVNYVDLEYSEGGVSKKAAIVFLLPEDYPASGSAKGYVAVFLQGATHTTLNFKWGPNETNSTALVRDTHQDTVLVDTSSLNRLGTVAYVGELQEEELNTLFGGYAFSGSPNSPGTNIPNNIAGSTTSIRTRFTITSREGDLKLEQTRKTLRSSPNEVTTVKMPVSSFILFLNRIRPIPKIPDIPEIPPPQRFVLRNRFIELFKPTTSSSLDTQTTTQTILNTANGSVGSIPVEGYASRIFDLWRTVSSLHLYMSTLTNARLTDFDRGGGGATRVAVFDLKNIAKELGGAGNVDTSNSAKAYFLSQMITRDSIFTGLESRINYSSLNTRFRGVNVQVKSGRVKGNGQSLRYLQRAFIVEQRYLDSSIESWYREVGASGVNLLGGAQSIAVNDNDVAGLQFNSNTGGSEYIIAAELGVVANLIDYRTDDGEELISYAQPFGSSPFVNRTFTRVNPVAWKCNRLCTVDVMAQFTTLTGGRRFKIRKFTAQQIGRAASHTLNVSDGEELVAFEASTSAQAPSVARTTLNPGDYLVATGNLNVKATFGGIVFRVQAFAL